jgi:hypothetical protein
VFEKELYAFERLYKFIQRNMFLTTQRCALGRERVFGPFFFVETTITSIVCLDALQQFLTPQLDEDDQEGRIHVQQDDTPLFTLEKCASTSTPVSQVGGLVEHGHLVPWTLHPWIFLTMTIPGKTRCALLHYDS